VVWKLANPIKSGDWNELKPAARGLGLFAVTAMLTCYAFEDRSPWFIVAFAVACAMGSLYSFLQGAWPYGLVEAIWSVVALRRWRNQSRHLKTGL
jgi:hypothetical protein